MVVLLLMVVLAVVSSSLVLVGILSTGFSKLVPKGDRPATVLLLTQVAFLVAIVRSLIRVLHVD